MSLHEAKWRDALQTAALQQRNGNFAASDATLVNALNALGAHADALHMLGLSSARRGHTLQGARLLREALDLSNWSSNVIKSSLTAMIANLLRERAVGQSAGRAAHSPISPDPNDVPANGPESSVSVVILANENAADLRASLESVLAQNLFPDVVVISYNDGTQKTYCATALSSSAREVDAIFADAAKANSSAHTPISQRIKAAVNVTSGVFVQLLRAGDQLTAERLSKLLALCSRSKLSFAFSRVQFVDQEGPIDELSDPIVFAAACAQSKLAALPFVELGLLQQDVIYGLSNFFFSRELLNVMSFVPESAKRLHWMYALNAIDSNDVVYVDEALCQLRHKALPESDLSTEESSLRSALWQAALNPVSACHIWASRAASDEASIALAYLEYGAEQDSFAHLRTIATRALAA